jgi:hypothetical protein
MAISRYAQRLLNPFRGVMNIIEHQGAEAVTVDGVHWDIYVRDIELVRDMPNSSRVQASDIRYGSWSARHGLKRGALYPSEDFRVLEHRGATVYEYLLNTHARLPFPLRDRFELWLLDEQTRPLALLNSAVREDEIEPDCSTDWRAGRECRRRFRTPALDDLMETTDPPVCAGDYLTRYVNARAGASPRAQWFERHADGSGTGLEGINVPASLRGRSLPTSLFPQYFLREDADGAAHRRLIDDFIAWQAPWVLLLQDLDDRCRQRFEQLARAHAIAVEKQYRLYPRIIDQDAINTARVEAALRNNAGGGSQEEEQVLSTYYIELNVTRTN